MAGNQTMPIFTKSKANLRKMQIMAFQISAKTGGRYKEKEICSSKDRFFNTLTALHII